MKKIIVSALLTTSSFSTMAAAIGDVVKDGDGREYTSVTEIPLKYFNPKIMCMYATKFYSEGSIIKTPDGKLKKCKHYYDPGTYETDPYLSWRTR